MIRCGIRFLAMVMSIFVVVSDGMALSPNSRRRIVNSVEPRAAAIFGSAAVQRSPTLQATAAQITAAMDVDNSIISSASVSGNASQFAVVEATGAWLPTSGSSFAVLSTGTAGGDSIPDEGTGYAAYMLDTGAKFDVAELKLVLNVPAGVTALSFDMAFVSAEYPEFVNSIFNDGVEILVNSGTTNYAVFDGKTVNVNNNVFQAGSDELLRGTRYHIFSGGKIDAGSTGWIRVIVPVISGSQNTVIIRVYDSSDPILDSELLLDGFGYGTLDAVDMYDVLLLGSQPTPASIMAVSRPARGLTADGVARVVLRYRSPSPGAVVFQTSDGALGSVEGTFAGASFTTTTGSGDYAFALLKAPEDFTGGNGAYNAEVSRPITVTANGAPLKLNLWRPPIVFVHGLWSKVWDAWGMLGTGLSVMPRVPAPENMTKVYGWRFAMGLRDLFLDALRAEYEMAVVDYSDNSADSFSVNKGKVRSVAFQTLKKMRQKNIAVAQVDVIAHSMGGLLTRFDVDRNDYSAPANYSSGWVNKLITLHTPHAGTVVASRIVALGPGTCIDTALKVIGRPPFRGAVTDLAVGSTELQGMKSTPVPSFAVYGVVSSPGFTLNALAFVDRWICISDVLLYNGSGDIIVPATSQRGGLGSGSVSEFPNDHVSFDMKAVREKVRDILNTPATSAFFGSFSAPSSISAPEYGPAAPRFMSGSLAPGLGALAGVSINSPESGTVILAGDTFLVTASSPADTVMFVYEDSASLDTVAPFTAIFKTDTSSLGYRPITVVASSAAGLGSSCTWVKVRPTSSPVRLFSSPGLIALDVGESRQVQISAFFNDSSVADVTAMCTYTSDTIAVATIDSRGVVGGIAAGRAGVSAVYETRVTGIGVTVSAPVTLAAAVDWTAVSSSASAVKYPATCLIGRHVPLPVLGMTRMGRDVLLQTRMGRQFVSLYYQFSRYVDGIRRSP